MKIVKKHIIFLFSILLLVSVLISYKIYRFNAFIWLPDYIFGSSSIKESQGPIDIIFVVVDHWEPNGKIDILNTWMNSYRKLADKHLDFDGIKLRHTWYYPIEQFRGYEVDSLVQLCREGYGEIEVHLHHRDDNSQSLGRLFKAGIDSLHAHKALLSPDGQTHFSFVHGNWALDNSIASQCGVNDEINILLKLGCYADLTFPAMKQPSQPALVNKIYYAKDDPLKPKSYNKGMQSKVGLQTESDQLMLIEGPLIIDWTDWRFKSHPTIEDGNLYWEIPTSTHRFKKWFEANVHVLGRPNWVFIKVFTHGAMLKNGGYDNILGENMDQMLTVIEEKCNDGKKYRLHYMTAREAYNVIKAAEKGLNGNPNNYRDYILKPYVYPISKQIQGEKNVKTK
jgi:hypothetical protein